MSEAHEANQAKGDDGAQVLTTELMKAEPLAATFQQIKAGCQGADADFICSQLEQGVTLDQAKTNWMAEQNKRIQATKKEVQQAEAQRDRPGVEPLGGAASSDDEGGDAIAAFDAAVDTEMKAGKGRQAAVRTVCRRDPELRERYVAEYNAAHPTDRRR